jgi:hypothetical protein
VDTTDRGAVRLRPDDPARRLGGGEHRVEILGDHGRQEVGAPGQDDVSRHLDRSRLGRRTPGSVDVQVDEAGRDDRVVGIDDRELRPVGELVPGHDLGDALTLDDDGMVVQQPTVDQDATSERAVRATHVDEPAENVSTQQCPASSSGG